MSTSDKHTCGNAAIKELLFDHVSGLLDAGADRRVRDHLGVCVDCRNEADVLRMVAHDPVPDPGGAFWATMPERVYRAVREAPAPPSAAGLLSGWALFARRLPLAAAAAVLVLLAWITVSVERHSPLLETAGMQRAADPIPDAGTLNMQALDENEATALAAWAGRELAAISREVAPLLRGASENDVYDEIAELDATQHEALQRLIDRHRKEART